MSEHAEGQQHPISIYLWIWLLLFVFSALSYWVDIAGFQGYLDKHLGVTEDEYQQSVGGLDAIRAIELPTY